MKLKTFNLTTNVARLELPPIPAGNYQAPAPAPAPANEPQGPEPTASLPPGCLPWLGVARQVLAGEFDGADRSTAESLRIGLRGIPHPLCREALARLPRVLRA